MKRLLFLITCFTFPFLALAAENSTSFLDSASHRLHQIWYEGRNELYLSGYAWHNRYAYSKDRVKTYNENAWGGGLGKSYFDEKGNWHGLYAFAFLDSHKNVEPIAGYAYLKVLHFNENISLGGGATVFLTSRPDIFNSIPFPGILPWAAFKFYRASLGLTYIPGAFDAGNVLFVTGKWLL